MAFVSTEDAEPDLALSILRQYEDKVKDMEANEFESVSLMEVGKEVH